MMKTMTRASRLRRMIYLLPAFFLFQLSCFASPIDDAADLSTQQAQEKQELNDMRKEMGDIKSIMNEAQQGMEQLRQKAAHAQSLQEVHLIARDAAWEVANGVSTMLFTYNGQLPGPVIRVKEGTPVRIVLHNQLREPTSLCLHGLVLPQAIAGLPRKEAGMVAPGATYAFQFNALTAGTYWYHPQVVHADQMARGLYGALVVEPVSTQPAYDRDVVLVLAKTVVEGKPFFTVNGKCAPLIPPIEVKSGERIRLRIINAGDFSCPIYLTGHRFDVVGHNGSDLLEPHLRRDTVCVEPGDRYDLEFTADNPGVWSLSSTVPEQTTTEGKFPGGIAVVVRYPEVLK